MNTESFVSVIKESVRTSAVDSTLSLLTKAPGRAPNPKLVALSNWYNSLTSVDKNNLKQAIEESVDAALLICSAFWMESQALNLMETAELSNSYITDTARVP